LVNLKGGNVAFALGNLRVDTQHPGQANDQVLFMAIAEGESPQIIRRVKVEAGTV
jgi:hypothetical protein